MYRKMYSDWKRRTNERQKLQGVYLGILVIGVTIAGLLSLFNAEAGRSLVIFAAVSGGIFAINLVVWSLIHNALGNDTEAEVLKTPVRRK